MNQDTVAVIVAAGSGTRLGTELPKAFVEVAGTSLLGHAMANLRAGGIDRFVVVVPEGWQVTTAKLVGPDAIVVVGGATRSASVGAGLAAVPADAVTVAVHDAARAFVPAAVVARAVTVVRDSDGDVVAAAPGLAVPDTLKRVEHRHVVATVDRDGLVAIQTPQVFPAEVLQAAHRLRGPATATDDLALVEELVTTGRMPGRIVVTTGSRLAFKVTTRDDLALARLVASGRSPREGRQ